MPHKCMECKNLIEGGTIDLQKGCPLCGSKKFQYIRPKPRPAANPTVAEYVASAALREPRAEAEEPAASRSPGKMPRDPGARELTAGEQPPGGTAGRAPRKKPAPDRDGDRHPGGRIESIRIIEQGTYDINLPLLLTREELVMSKEEGSYVVDLDSVLKRGKKKKRK